MLKRYFSRDRSGWRKKKNRNMAVGTEIHGHQKVSSNFKSKLALVLSTRGNKGSNKPINRGGYKSLKQILNTHTLPVTLTLKDFSEERCRGNGLCTIQSYKKLTQLKCLTPRSESIFVPICENSKATVKFLSIDTTAMFSTMEQLRAKKREFNITWFMATKAFSLNSTHFNEGQIFTFAGSSLLSSFKRDRNIRGVTVIQYGTKKKYFLPLDTEGHFRKCDPPSTYQTCNLGELAKSWNFPYVIVLQKDSVHKEMSAYCGLHLFVKEKQENEIVYATKNIRSSLQIHSFFVSDDIYAENVGQSKHVDTLDSNELKIVENSFTSNEILIQKQEEKENYYEIKTYNELGIIRLLEEIFKELSSLNRTHVKSSKHPKTNHQKTTVSRKNTTEAQYLQSVDGRNLRDKIDYDYVTKHGLKKYYVNESDDDKDADKNRKKRELIVEFDDGGYVVIPFSGHSPKISLEREKYKTHDNIAYNYIKQTDSDESDINLDAHVYEYISNENLIEKTLENRELNTATVTKNNRNQQIGKNTDTERCSMAYDYSHLGHFSIPSLLSRKYIKQLSLEEVVDLLKGNLLKTHIDEFKFHSIDGQTLSVMCEKDFLNLNFTKFEARKLACFVDGWRPKVENDSKTWLSKLAKDWNIQNVSNYLQHINMHSFQQFALKHQIDGFLLRELVKDDLLDSMVTEHKIVLNKSNVDRLRKYVMEDEKTKFKYFQ